MEFNPELERAEKEGWAIPLGVSEDEQIDALIEQASKAGINFTREGARQVIRDSLGSS